MREENPSIIPPEYGFPVIGFVALLAEHYSSAVSI
jgi:hypothetical protein